MRGHIRRRGERSWRIKFDLTRDPVTGARRTQYITVRGTKREAEAELARLLGSLQAGTYTLPTKITVGELLVKWRDDVAAARASDRTLEGYAHHVDRLIAGLGSIPLSQLNPLAIQSFYTDLRRNGHRRRQGGLSEQTLLHIHKVLKAALDQAVRWRLTAVNPAADVSAPRPARVEIHTLNQDETARLI